MLYFTVAILGFGVIKQCMTSKKKVKPMVDLMLNCRGEFNNWREFYSEK